MKKALIVVDFQNDFVNGTLGFESAPLLEEGIRERLNQCKKEGYDIYYTMDTHMPDYLETREGVNLPISHCIKNTNGWKLHGLEEDLRDATELIKYSFGGFECYDGFPQYEEVELCGLVTNICVISNAIVLQSKYLSTKITVNANLCDSFDKELHNKALDIMEGLQINIIR